jgi:hypothetical protein
VCCGCSATVYSKSGLLEPVPVYVPDYGVHSTVILPTADGSQFVEYAFGDWRFAVLNHDGPFDGLAALFGSKQSGFGRRYLRAEPDPANNVPAPTPRPVKKMALLFAERADVDIVRKELDERYARGNGPPVHNPLSRIDYVIDADTYRLGHNCNHLTARLLRKLGCDVKGPTVLSGFKVVERGGADADAGGRIPPTTQRAPPGGPL